MDVVSLEGLEFFAYHGYYDEEQKVGNKYAVDIRVMSDFHKAAEDDSLSETVDYEKLYKIVEKEMRISSRLLENIGERICHSVFERYPQIHKIEVSISKFNPPIGGVCTRAKITLKRSRQP
ncbi:dihydroneopterin aldolase [Fulvivirgaceae bacterium BMA10]|uniref:7,8-dihydroneopterin aldolase n=1 Tax=Splendidivirga corallicola TaxID=3051826 RepID=A0ABT8KT35_9BACT|nr:dihydroneopterin aldolase [Fulvivirgaceae bacterium BMA10]